VIFVFFCISDLPEFCRTDGVELKLFADDLKAYHISKSNLQFHLPLQNFIDKLKEYCSINSLQIAEKKCFTLHIGTKNPKHDYSLSFPKSLIPKVPEGESVRDLGIHFTQDLKWKSHIEKIVNKARRISYALLKSLKSKIKINRLVLELTNFQN
jgi:hypothetical protein